VWVIVDDGSTDDTAAIVESYLPRCAYIRLIRLPPKKDRSFGSKDRAINQAYATLRDMAFEFVGVLDTDVSLESSDYFKDVLAAFAANDKLAITGGVVCEEKRGVFRERAINVPWSVPGCVQTFRRRCYDIIGGFVPLEHGGSDTLMELELRRRGYVTQTIPHLRVRHHRRTSSANGILRGLFRLGQLDASFGSHPLFMVAKCLRRTTHQPLLVGAVMIYAGYLAYHLRGYPYRVPAEVTAFLRKEQLSRLLRNPATGGTR
jgi:glycosyltransferase involved in cell wall biosynthesis